MKQLMIASFLLFTTILTIESQVIKGVIRDAKSNEPLIGVNIAYKEGGKTDGTNTDIDGKYSLKVPDGGAILTYSYLGYDSQTISIIVGKNKTFTQDVFLATGAMALGDVVVSAGRFEQKLSEITVSMNLLKVDDIAKQNVQDLSSLLNTVSGVDVNDNQPTIRGGSGWTYGVGSRVLVMTDGMPVITPSVGDVNWDMIPMENVSQIEVIKGASSVLYGSSALNGLINIRTARPGIDPETKLTAYWGIYMDPKNQGYEWSDDNFWKDGKYPVKPLLRNALFFGVANPIYEGYSVSHSRRIGSWDVSGGLDLMSDEGYREGNYNQRVRFNGSIIGFDKVVKGLSYGGTFNVMATKSSDFFAWKSSEKPYNQSPLTNLSRESTLFYMDPFITYANTEKGYVHSLKTRYFYRGEQIQPLPAPKPITEILDNMGTTIPSLLNGIDYLKNDFDMKAFEEALKGKDFNKVLDMVGDVGSRFFPTAQGEDIVDLLYWGMNSGKAGTIQPSDQTHSFYADYQFNKRLEFANFTTGLTFQHVSTTSPVNGNHASDNIAAYFQWDQKFLEKLNVSAGLRLEYYRMDDQWSESSANVFGLVMPVTPIFRCGLNYEATESTFLRGSFGMGYRYPSIVEKFIVKDIGGLAAYPNKNLKPENGLSAELGIKQGFKWGNLTGFVDVAGFYTHYDDMIEFQVGVFNTETYEHIDRIDDVLTALPNIGLGVNFINLDKADIFGVDASITGQYKFSNVSNLNFNLGYVFVEPLDLNWKGKDQPNNEGDPLKMKSKSNNSPYLKYRQRHSFKAVLDYQYRRLMVGLNMNYKSKTEAVDYFLVDERTPEQQDNSDKLMATVREVIFPGLHDYWMNINKHSFFMDVRVGVEVTSKVKIWLMCNNVLNSEYSLRPMDVSPPRTLILQLNAKF